MISISRTKLAYRVSMSFEHQDERGRIFQPFNAVEWQAAVRRYWAENGVGDSDFPFVWKQENVIVEYYPALRGLHTDLKSWKLASCLLGRVRLGLLNTNTMETETMDLGDAPTTQVLIPPWVANGHAVLTPIAVFHYLWSQSYEPQRVFRWDAYGIDWGVEEPLLSEQDRKALPRQVTVTTCNGEVKINK